MEILCHWPMTDVPGILNASLAVDTRFFDMTGDDDKRMAFIQVFVRQW